MQATYIHSAIVRALKQATPINPKSVPSNLVYDHPTISSLYAAIEGDCRFVREDEARIQGMNAMVDKYSPALITRRSQDNSGAARISNNEEGRVVVITGTTGRLGCYLLSRVLQDQSIATVFALNRGHLATIRQRQENEFNRWGLDIFALGHSKVKFLQADLSRPDLGLSRETYEAVRDTSP